MLKVAYGGDQYVVTLSDDPKAVWRSVKVWKRGRGHWKHHWFWGAADKRDKPGVIRAARHQQEFLDVLHASVPQYPRLIAT